MAAFCKDCELQNWQYLAKINIESIFSHLYFCPEKVAKKVQNHLACFLLKYLMEEPQKKDKKRVTLAIKTTVEYEIENFCIVWKTLSELQHSLIIILIILLTNRGWSVWENIDLGHESVLTTFFKILPNRPPPWLIITKYNLA